MTNPERSTCFYHLILNGEYLHGLEFPWASSMSHFGRWIKDNNFEVSPDLWVIRSRSQNRAYRVKKSERFDSWNLHAAYDYPKEIEAWANFLGIPLNKEDST